MGIYDRDYYRKEGPSFLGSFALRGRICKWLIGVNVLVFVLQLLGRPEHASPITEALILIPQKVTSGEVWRLLTYAFLHDTSGPWHIVFNMWLLWMFGGYIEDLYGPWEFLAFYLVSAVCGGAAFVVQGLLTNPLIPCLGASGAVMAVTILCAFHYPTLTVLFMFVLPLPIWVLAVLLVVQDSFGLLGGEGNVAYSVHLGGAAFAALYYKLHLRMLSFLPPLREWPRPRSRPRPRPRLRVYHGEAETPHEVVPASGPPPMDVDEQLEAKVDAVLAKVARSGRESLSDNEKQLLLRASEIYKKRRS